MNAKERAEKIWHRGAPYFGARDKDREVTFITTQIKEAEREAYMNVFNAGDRAGFHAGAVAMREKCAKRVENTLDEHWLTLATILRAIDPKELK